VPERKGKLRSKVPSGVRDGRIWGEIKGRRREHPIGPRNRKWGGRRQVSLQPEIRGDVIVGEHFGKRSVPLSHIPIGSRLGGKEGIFSSWKNETFIIFGAKVKKGGGSTPYFSRRQERKRRGHNEEKKLTLSSWD